MKVAQLIRRLQKLDPKLDVVIMADAADYIADVHPTLTLDTTDRSGRLVSGQRDLEPVAKPTLVVLWGS